MTTWHETCLADLSRALPEARVEPYGSVAEGAADGWSDLDVIITTESPVEIETALSGELWAFQSTLSGEEHVIRAVLVDGRRIDMTVRGVEATLSDLAADNAVRFDLALAAAKLGRGSDLIGLHLCLGALRDALVLGMEQRDRELGHAHHREATAHDRDALRVLDSLGAPLEPATALRTYETYGAWRRALEPTYVPDPRGLEALIARSIPA
ncbi:nucleotidyltransferase domain-containing protein [Brachybacterium sp. UMB0905]|uniref:nucleotidyltransferase domain-containing protein n=1 Tax=Brachybacterium sp. UMB0905 TaxID=2069310 RepID=UPI000C7FC6E5|nr:nucleotidyltransferase domain-containing protein [Brachybacterium sp. UMB0905]PMC74457.1 hypothetical protein CJ197_13535 [Brachybacterium sp. UMB0905]